MVRQQVVQAGLQPAAYPKMSLNFWFSCFYLPHAAIASTYHQTQVYSVLDAELRTWGWWDGLASDVCPKACNLALGSVTNMVREHRTQSYKSLSAVHMHAVPHVHS